jgi:hypothetical protein
MKKVIITIDPIVDAEKLRWLEDFLRDNQLAYLVRDKDE